MFSPLQLIVFCLLGVTVACKTYASHNQTMLLNSCPQSTADTMGKTRPIIIGYSISLLSGASSMCIA